MVNLIQVIIAGSVVSIFLLLFNSFFFSMFHNVFGHGAVILFVDAYILHMTCSLVYLIAVDTLHQSHYIRHFITVDSFI